jgi:streptogramin lyase
MAMSRSRIWMSMMLLLGIATLGLGMPAGATPGAPETPQAVSNASCIAPGPHGFNDVPDDSYYNTAVAWLVEAGITGGTSPGKYSPNNPVTRAQMAVFLWHNAGDPTPAGPHNFSDVPTTSYYNTAVSWLVEAGITGGTSPGKYSPNNPVTRAQMAVFLWHNAGDPTPTGPHNFTDVPTNSYYNTAVAWLVEAGITGGTSPGKYSPNNQVTRGQMAVFLWKYNCPDLNLGDVTTLAGNGTFGFADGPGNTAQFDRPNGVAVAPNGTVYVADIYNHRIRTINPTTGQVTTLAGNGTLGFADGPGTTAQFNNPFGVAVAPTGTIYVGDTGNHRIRTINPTTGQVTTLAGTGNDGFTDGPGATAQFSFPRGVAVAPGGTIYVADTLNDRIRTINPTTGQVTTLAGTGTPGFADGPSTTAQFRYPADVTVAPNGTVYVADSSNDRIRTINPTTGQVTTLAGTGTPGFADGPSTNAKFNNPSGVSAAPGGTVYVADSNNDRIRAINPTTGQVTTLAGTGTAGFADGPSTTAQFNGPDGVTVAPNGTVYVADSINYRIRKIT